MRLSGSSLQIAKRLVSSRSTKIRLQPSISPTNMDKIPIHKLRRKPKPPAIETSVDRSATDSTHLAPEDAKPSKSPMFPSRMSPFRRLRGEKRARSCSPAPSQFGEAAATVVSNGAKVTNGQGDEQRLKIPAFLTQSDEGNFAPIYPTGIIIHGQN